MVPLSAVKKSYAAGLELPRVTCWSFDDIRAQRMQTEFMYVITQKGELLISNKYNMDYQQLNSLIHPVLANFEPVLAAGELVVERGKITHIDNHASYYYSHGRQLTNRVETIFVDRGFPEARGIFNDGSRLPYGLKLVSDDPASIFTLKDPLGSYPSPLGTMFGTTIASTRQTTPAYNSSFLFGVAYAESLDKPHQSAHPSHKKNNPTMPTTPEKTQQALDLVEQDLQALLTSFGDIVTASEKLDISDVKDMDGVQGKYDEIEALKSQQHTRGSDPILTQEIADKTRALKAQIIPELIKRKKFTENLQYASNTVTGVVRGLRSFNNPELTVLAEQISTVGSSVMAAVEQGGALLGMGMAAATLNPVFAIGTLMSAVGNVVGLFQKKQQQDPNEMLLRVAKMLYERIEQFERSMLIEFSKLSSEVADSRWQVLARLEGIAERQHDTLSFLNSISLEISKMRADQGAQLITFFKALSNIRVNLASTSYRTNLDKLQELMRFIVQNSIFKNYNELMNQLDHIALQTSGTRQASELFELEGTKPASYFQFYPYFAHLISSTLAGTQNNVTEMEDMPNPLLVIFATICKIGLASKQYPVPNATRASSRISERDIAQLEIYATELAKFEKLGKQARNRTVWDRAIKAYDAAANALHIEIAKDTYQLEITGTSNIRRDMLARLSPQHAEEKDSFNKEIDVGTYEWFKGRKKGKYKRRVKGDFWNEGYDYWLNPTDDPYVDVEKREDYLKLQKKHIQSTKEKWNPRISESRELIAKNHLSTTLPATISPYHGARFLKPTQQDLPYLPAPDPLLPTNHSQFEMMRVLQEAQAYGLGSIELFYTAISETRTFVIDIMFHQTIASALTKEPIASLQFSYDPLSGYNRAEAIWYEFAGHDVFVPPLEGDWKEHETQYVRPNTADREVDYFTWSVFLPKPARVRDGKLEEWEKIVFNCTVRNRLLDTVKDAVHEARGQFIARTREQTSHLLDYTTQNKIGGACHAFEEASRHLFGILSYGFFDEIQNSQSPLAKWFTNHAANTEQLRSFLLATTQHYPLRKLSDDLPKLQGILSALPPYRLYFYLLNETIAVLQEFLRIYKPFAVKHNAEVPTLDSNENVKNLSNRLLVGAIKKILKHLPPDEAASEIHDIFKEEAPHAYAKDPVALEEVVQSFLDEINRQELTLSAPSVVPRLEPTSPHTAEIDASQQEKGDLSSDETMENDSPPVSAEDDDQNDLDDSHLSPDDFKVEDADDLKPGSSNLPFAHAAQTIPVSAEQKTAAVASSATRSAAMPFFILPLHIAKPIITTSFAGLKAVGSGFVSFVKTSWEQSSDHPRTSSPVGTSQETTPFHSSGKNKHNTGGNAHQQQNDAHKRQKLYMDARLFELYPAQPIVTASEAAQVAVPLVNKACEQHGLFGHKPLATDQITKYRANHEIQFTSMGVVLNEMLAHPILKRRREVGLVKETLKQARDRFKSIFKNYPRCKVTQSQQAELSHLVAIAREKLLLANIVKEKIGQQGSVLIEAMTKGEQALKKAQKILDEIRASFQKEMGSIKRQQRNLNKTFEQGEIAEAELEYLEIALEEKMREAQRACEAFETIESDLDFVITKIRDTLNKGEFEQLDAVQTNVALLTQATEYLLTRPALHEGEHKILQSVREKAEAILDSEKTKMNLEPLGAPAPQSLLSKSTSFWMSAPKQELPGARVGFTLPSSGQ